VFFIQAEKNYNPAPSHVLSEVMRNADKPMRVHVFAANGTTEQEGHGFCRGGVQPAWGPEVLEFLRESFERQQPAAAY